MAERFDPSTRRSQRPPLPSIFPRVSVEPGPPRSLPVRIVLSMLTILIAIGEWAITPVQGLLRVTLLRTRRAPMSVAEEVNALGASITKAVAGANGTIVRVTNAELLAEMTWTVIRCAFGKPPRVVPPKEIEREFPESYLVPFHGQPNGYLSTAAPALTERHMEATFGEQLSVMRHAVAEGLGQNLRHGVVLDLGAGTGTMLRVLRIHHKRARLFGVELSPYMIASAYAHQLHYLDDHVEVVEANVTSLPFDDASVRGVTACLMLHELPEADLPRALKEAVRVLAPGGRLVILDLAAPRTLRERAAMRVSTRVFYEPYVESFVQADLGAYVERSGLTRVELRDMPRGTRLYVYEKPVNAALLN